MIAKFKMYAKDFQKAAQLYAAATKKDGAYILNRAGMNVAFRAAQGTPRANANAILRALSKDRNELAVKILSKRGKFKGVSIKDRKQIVRKFISARRRSAGYIRAGWGPAIEAFGGNATRLRINPKSKLGQGYGIKARPNRLVAELANAAFGAHRVGAKPFQQAIDFVARDMLDYALRKLAKTAREYSA